MHQPSRNQVLPSPNSADKVSPKHFDQLAETVLSKAPDLITELNAAFTLKYLHQKDAEWN
jgi:hypothetical protein